MVDALIDTLSSAGKKETFFSVTPVGSFCLKKWVLSPGCSLKNATIAVAATQNPSVCHFFFLFSAFSFPLCIVELLQNHALRIMLKLGLQAVTCIFKLRCLQAYLYSFLFPLT